MENNLTQNKRAFGDIFDKLKEYTYKGSSKEEAFNEYKKKHPNVVIDLSNKISIDQISENTPYILFGSKMLLYNGNGSIYNKIYKIRKVYFTGLNLDLMNCFETEDGEAVYIAEIADGFISVYLYEDEDYVCK